MFYNISIINKTKKSFHILLEMCVCMCLFKFIYTHTHLEYYFSRKHRHQELPSVFLNISIYCQLGCPRVWTSSQAGRCNCDISETQALLKIR